MRRKFVLSHPQRLFPTFPTLAVKVSVWLPVLLAPLCLPALAQTQSVALTGKATVKPNDKDAPTIIEAEQISGRPERFIQFDDRVEVLKGATTLNANHAIYRNLEDQVDITGDVRMQREGDCYSGDSARMQLGTGIGFVMHPVYKLLRNNAQGHADKITFENEEQSTIYNGTYSTCEGLDPDWYLRADTLKLDTGLDTGVAGNSVVYFKGVPILATSSLLPLSFALSGARHSGLLPPTLSTTSKGGIELGIPYYFNIAPNRDLTVHPTLIQRRGLQLGLEGRYLGETYAGETSIEGLLNDQQTKTNRYAITSIHTQKLLPELVFSWNVNHASDDDYPSDFSKTVTKTAQRLLLRETSMQYYGAFWSADLRASNYQVLQDLLAPIARPYDRLPQLTLHTGQLDNMGLDWSADTILTRFWHPSLVRGDRAVVNTQVSAPFVQPGYFVVPKLALHAASYQLSNTAAGQGNDFQSVVPTFSIDSGLVFERPSSLLGESMTQTLEPRLFYVNTPYRDQSLLPNFDSAVADFNFAQIFSENRFTGNDRVGDSNQITAALVSRYIENNGEERVKFALGQRFYFNTQRVTLDTAINQSRSDLLLAATGKLSASLSAEASVQVSQSDRQAQRSNFGVRWQPGAKKVLNLEYRFQRDLLKQVDLSVQWPVADRWYMVGRSNFSLQNNKLVDGLVGFEYKQDCWAFRLLAQRFTTNSSTSTSGLSVQLELTGLARLGFGSNPIDALKKNISGYQPIN